MDIKREIPLLQDIAAVFRGAGHDIGGRNALSINAVNINRVIKKLDDSQTDTQRWIRHDDNRVSIRELRKACRTLHVALSPSQNAPDQLHQARKDTTVLAALGKLRKLVTALHPIDRHTVGIEYAKGKVPLTAIVTCSDLYAGRALARVKVELTGGRPVTVATIVGYSESKVLGWSITDRFLAMAKRAIHDSHFLVRTYDAAIDMPCDIPAWTEHPPIRALSTQFKPSKAAKLG